MVKVEPKRVEPKRILLVIGILCLAGGAILPLSVGADYWDHIPVEVYRGYDIEFFPGPGGLYGVYQIKDHLPPSTTFETFNPGDWRFFVTVDAARLGIDEMVVPPTPTFIQDYTTPSGTVYKLYSIFTDGLLVYYGVDPVGLETSRHLNIQSLEGYIDTLAPVEPPPEPVYFTTNRILVLSLGCICIVGAFIPDIKKRL